jgi:hypothetical protein
MDARIGGAAAATMLFASAGTTLRGLRSAMN